MAGDAAHLLDGQQQHVAIAIGANAENFLEMSGLLALAPQAAARTRPVHGITAGQGFGQRLAVHVGEHHDPPFGVLGNRRDHPVGVPFERLVERQRRIKIGHYRRTSIPRPAMYSLA